MSGNNASVTSRPLVAGGVRSPESQKQMDETMAKLKKPTNSFLMQVPLAQSTDWINPKTMLLFGPPKVGKTTFLSQFHQAYQDKQFKLLIMDMEEGGRGKPGYIWPIKNLQMFRQFVKEIVDGEHDFTHVAIDVIDQLSVWMDSYAVWLHNKINSTDFKYISDIEYGAGFAKSREEFTKLIHHLMKRVDVILIGHRKVASQVGTVIDPTSIDLQGKLRNIVCGMCDAIGYMHRDDQNQLMVSFQSNNSLDAGSRCPQLAGQIIPADWRYIYR